MTGAPIPFQNYSDEPLFNIQAVAEKTDVPTLTLRAWERRYGIPKPARDEQGHRLYSERDVMIIHWLKRQVDSSMRIKQAVNLLYSRVPQHLELTAPTGKAPVFEQPMTTRFDELADELFGVIRGFDYSRAQAVLTHTLSIYPIEDVCLGVLLPVFEKIDQAYQAGELTLQGEHFGSNLIRERLLSILTTPATPHRAGRIVVGCAPHEWHEIGALMYSLFLRRRGWEIIYLGQNVGFSGLHETVTHLRPDVFTLSVSHLPNLCYLEEVAQVIAAASDNRAAFTYAGRVFTLLGDLLDDFPGVYLGHSLLEAVEQVEQLLQERWRPQPYSPSALDEVAAQAQAYLKSQQSVIEGAISSTLADQLAEEERAEPSLLAQAIVRVLMVTVRYDAPEVLEMLHAMPDATLPSYGMPVTQLASLVDVLRDYFAAQTAPAVAALLDTYLDYLHPDITP